MRDEELASTGIAPGEGHADGAAEIWLLVQLVANRVARSAVAIAARVASLNDKVRDHAMEHQAVEVAFACERHEVVRGDRRIKHVELDLDRALVRFDEYVR